MVNEPRVESLSPDVDRESERAGAWLVLDLGDGWLARHVDESGQATGREIESPYRGMIVDYLRLLDLLRHEPEPGDAPDVVERWTA